MRLQLDFVHPRPRPARLGWVLLSLGVALALWSGWRYHAQAQALEAARAVLAQQEAPRAAPRRALASPRAEVSPLTEAARQALQADWSGLLDALEVSRPDGIALLSLELDAPQGRLRLSAQARTPGAMLDYLDRLEDVGLRQVRLQTHQTRSEADLEYLEFAATAHWPQPGGRP